MMPEIFFLYYEELDWSTSMTRAGYELWYDPCCTIFHKESQSTGQLSKLRTYYLTRNRLFYARRNLKGFNRIASIIYQSTVAATKNSLAFILKRAFRLGGSHILWSKLRTSSPVIRQKRALSHPINKNVVS